MSACICGLCHRLIPPDSTAGWTSIGGFKALYCEGCLRAHAAEFPQTRIVGKSARVELEAGRAGRATTTAPISSPPAAAPGIGKWTEAFDPLGGAPPEMPKCPNCGSNDTRAPYCPKQFPQMDWNFPSPRMCAGCLARKRYRDYKCDGCGQCFDARPDVGVSAVESAVVGVALKDIAAGELVAVKDLPQRWVFTGNEARNAGTK